MRVALPAPGVLPLVLKIMQPSRYPGPIEGETEQKENSNYLPHELSDGSLGGRAESLMSNNFSSPPGIPMSPRRHIYRLS